MIITVKRQHKTVDGIFGTLSIDSHPFNCYTVERLDKAVLPGIYLVEFTYSPKFNQTMPLIDVPERDGIRIHPANRPDQLEGCIGVGDKQEPDAVDNSRITFNKLNTIISDQKDLKIQITEEYA